jgi:hypothetical protein
MVKRYGLDNTAQKYIAIIRVSEGVTKYGDAAMKER